MNKEKIAYHVREILKLIGEDPDRPGLVDTPRRVADSYEELYSGLHNELGVTVFDNVEQYNELVVMKDIPFVSVCEHHLVPFIGVCQVGYLPDANYLGLSKIVRVVEHFARRPQVQERLVGEIADYLHDAVESRGTMVVMSATHLCMTIRGVRTADVKTTTAAIRPDDALGHFPRDEFLSYINGRH